MKIQYMFMQASIYKFCLIMVKVWYDQFVTNTAYKIQINILLNSTEYVTDVLEDAQVYSGHAGRKDIDADDVKLAIQTRLDHSFTIPPPRDVRHGFILIYITYGSQKAHLRN